MPKRVYRQLRDRISWVWNQETVWADVVGLFALGWWSYFDLTAAPGVSERPAFAQIGLLIPDEVVSAFTVCLTLFQGVAILARSTKLRGAAAALQGVFWMSVSITLFYHPAAITPLTTGACIAIWGCSWLSMISMTHKHVITRRG